MPYQSRRLAELVDSDGGESRWPDLGGEMHRRQRRQLPQAGQDLIGYQLGAREVGAAVNDAMPHSIQTRRQVGLQPVERMLQRLLLMSKRNFLMYHLAVTGIRHVKEATRYADALRRASEDERFRVTTGDGGAEAIQGKFKARRAAVDGKYLPVTGHIPPDRIQVPVQDQSALLACDRSGPRASASGQAVFNLMGPSRSGGGSGGPAYAPSGPPGRPRYPAASALPHSGHGWP